jgi:hypothetical protein
MNPEALTIMITAQVIIVSCMGFFFYKVLSAPKKDDK